MLESIWLALQFYDDVMDWEDDWARGGAWAVALTHGALQEQRHPAGDGLRAPVASALSLEETKALVLSTGTLVRMLELSRREFTRARRRAEVLGARRIAAWARAREGQMRELVRCEAESPGYAHRARALSAWARTVLA